ncbi:MAG: DNA-3-methyladenine glycosylase I [Candidatus Diapherotrites archaeon]|nr:DNA-3-methyladenine glycosylase I [Candidatus Diapherotrites archaeon]MDZ4256104.1 DNA-3-methyladenine glycosylase I [archaeon]
MKKRAYKAKTDDNFLNQVSFIVFVVRFNYKVVEAKWPQIEKAFFHFNIDRLSKMDENDLEPFLRAPGMIKNPWKIHSVLINARKCAELRDNHETVLNWIAHAKEEIKKSPVLAPDLRECFQTFRGIGPLTSTWLESIYSSEQPYVEYELPD